MLVNAWDAASARVIASAPGCRAVATASWAVAAAHGAPDGEVMGREAMLAAVARIAAAVELPVTADLEAGYGEDPHAVGETVGAAIAAGAVGCNLEDGRRDPAEHAARVAAAVAAGGAAGVEVVVNARTDVYLLGLGEPDARLAAALARGRAYADAGAACVFVPGVGDLGEIERLVEGMGAPVGVLGSAGGPTVAELAGAGVARVSYGPGPMGIAMAALARAAEALLSEGKPPADLAFRPPLPSGRAPE